MSHASLRCSARRFSQDSPVARGGFPAASRFDGTLGDMLGLATQFLKQLRTAM